MCLHVRVVMRVKTKPIVVRRARMCVRVTSLSFVYTLGVFVWVVIVEGGGGVAVLKEH